MPKQHRNATFGKCKIEVINETLDGEIEAKESEYRVTVKLKA